MKKGEIWLVKFPQTNGKEQTGIRPVIILADTKTNVSIIIPLTSTMQTLRFPYTFKIKPSEINELQTESVVLIFQVRAIDKKRFVNKIGILEDSYMSQINELLKKLFQI